MSYILNKKLLCSLAIAGTMINSTAFASENPFATVPKDYWAYTAVEHLVETGLVDGYNLTDNASRTSASKRRATSYK